MWHSQVARFNCLTRYNLTLFILKIVLKAWIIPKILIFHQNNPIFKNWQLIMAQNSVFWVWIYEIWWFSVINAEAGFKLFNFWWKWSFFQQLSFFWRKLHCQITIFHRKLSIFYQKMFDFLLKILIFNWNYPFNCKKQTFVFE